MSARAHSLRCPECQSELRADRTRMNIDVDVCPNEHGIFLDAGDVRDMVGPAAAAKIRGLVAREGRGTCPACAASLGNVRVMDVRSSGCRNCGSLWFPMDQLKSHVHEVRKRAYGPGSMAARPEVARDATAFYPAEVVAGILTEFQLEQEL